ncbi:hypothetical protein J1N35_019102 [Gossypium stocksii]|uniref:RNase H type-1 domain-containing protein n=1 Tax=Gossypium stocksii TaxID=47602 RepID=A0A9D3VRQ3_9ROSI|nr:hypothetical protein J1N35_019102 [Gossypium stocksii]
MYEMEDRMLENIMQGRCSDVWRALAKVWLPKDIVKRIVSIPPPILWQNLIESIGFTPQQDPFLLKVRIDHYERIRGIQNTDGIDIDPNITLLGNWIHLHTDGAVKMDTGFAAVGGVMCEQNEK